MKKFPLFKPFNNITMKNYPLLLLSIIALLFVNTLPGMAQTAVKLALKKGDKFYAEQIISAVNKVSTPTGDMDMPEENIIGITYEVLSENNGTNDIKMTFSSMKYKSKDPMSGGDLLFDSQKKRDIDGNLGIEIKKTMGQSYVFTIDANSRKIITIKDRPKVVAGVEQEQMSPMPDHKLFPQSDAMLYKRVGEALGGSLPINALPAAGYSWSRSDTTDRHGLASITDITYKVDTIKDRKINVAITTKGSDVGTVSTGDMEMKISGSSSGTGSEVIDAGTGLLIEKKVAINGQMSMESDMGPQKVLINTTMKLTIKKIQ